MKVDEEEVQLFKCLHCTFELTSVQDLHSHIAKQHNDTSNTCIICGKMCVDLFLYHLGKISIKNIPFFRFSTFSSLCVHLRRHANIRNFSCSDCDQKFITSSGLARHIFTHAKQKPFQCSYCEMNFAARSDLSKHEQMHTGKRYACSKCNKAYTTSSNLKEHMKSHNPKSAPKICSYCSFSCGSSNALASHIKSVHEQGLIECDICKRLFTSLPSFTKHNANHHKNMSEKNQPKVQCSICNRTYSNHKNLKEHNKRKHDNLGRIHLNKCSFTIITWKRLYFR